MNRLREKTTAILLIILLQPIFAQVIIGNCSPGTYLISGWLQYPVTIDGQISSIDEWSDTDFVDMDWGLGIPPGPPYVNARVWAKNDDTWLYLLYRVEWPSAYFDANDSASVSYFWGAYVPPWDYADTMFVSFGGSSWDGYGWNDTKWFSDTDAGGENNTEGAATYDGTYYWFEIKKELSSGDGYDWSLEPGKAYGFNSEAGGSILVGLWDRSIRSSYHEYVHIYISKQDPIENSIERGLNWLADQQNETDGSWGDWNYVSKTGLAVLKFIDRAKELGKDPFGLDYEYHTQVQKGMEYIFTHANTIPIGLQPAGDPDSDGDGLGVYITDWGGQYSYDTGISLMAISAAKPYAPGNVPTGSLAGWTYADIIEDIVDYLAFGQSEGLWSGRGGWGYEENSNWSDNSNTGWVTLGLGYAMASGETVPQFVLTELNIWIDYIQNTGQYDWFDPDPDGGSGYSGPGDWVNMLKTGNLLYQMALVGDTNDTQRVKDAIAYQERHWNYTGWDPGWNGSGGYPDWAHHQATFCIMKGFESLGIDTITVGTTEIDWFDDISTRILQTQNPDGSWFNDYWGDDILSTTWALLTLEKTVAIPVISVSVDIKPGSWPNPINKGKNGVTSVAICGTEEFDIMTIDPSKVMMYNETFESGVSPLRWSYEDVATPYPANPDDHEGHEEKADGYIDLVLKFDTPELVGTLELCEILDWEYVKLYLKGNLFDEEGGTPIEGFDWVRIQSPKGKAKGKS